jgi:DNA-binding MarR family transcriptional regulator
MMKKTIIQQLDDFLPYHLYMIGRLLRHYLQQTLNADKDHFTPEQFFILHRLYFKDAQTQKELANKILQDHPNITRLLDKLEKNGFVQREDDENSRRNFIIKLSAKGRKSFERIIPLIKKEREQLLKGISMEEMIMAQEIINRIKANIGT